MDANLLRDQSIQYERCVRKMAAEAGIEGWLNCTCTSSVEQQQQKLNRTGQKKRCHRKIRGSKTTFLAVGKKQTHGHNLQRYSE